MELFKVLGGGHTWPGALVDIAVTNHDIHASSEIWWFFNRYDLGTLTGTSELAMVTAPFTVYPNPATDVFHLSFPDARQRTLSVVSATGQLIMQHNTSASVFDLQIEEQGLYVITVQDADRFAARQVLKL